MAHEEKTEKATSRRRRRAREQGQFAFSQELSSAAGLTVTAVVLFSTFSSIGGFRAHFQQVMNSIARGDGSNEALFQLIRETGGYGLLAVAPVLAAAMFGALAGNVVQGLPIFAPEAATLKWDRLNPVAGLSRLKVRFSWIEWARLLVLVGVIGVVVWSAVSAYWSEMAASPAASIEYSNGLTRTLLWRIVTSIVLVVGVLAVADFFVQRWRFEKSIKQTKAEVKEDNKDMEGNPTIRGKIRSIQREQARRRMMTRVKDADVIVTNPTHFAVALEYKPETSAAPRVVAKGRDLIAQRIKQLGREYDIPMVENVSLARALYRSVELEQDIPPALYKAVAEVLAYVFRIRKKLQ